VLSPTTAAFDAGGKLDAYRRIPSLVDYLLIASDRVGVTHYLRARDGRWSVTTHGAGDVVALGTGPITLEVDALYRGALLR